MNYIKERNKMLVWLVVGIMFLIGVLYVVASFGNGIFLASFSGIFIIVALVLYPLALVYGRSQIVDIFHSIRMGARQPFLTKRLDSPWRLLFAVLNTVIALLTVVFFGWIYGSYTAYQKLQMLKSYHVK